MTPADTATSVPAGESAASSQTDRIVILDEVRVRAGTADAWIDRWRTDYLPAARGRGLRLRGLWTASTEDADVEVVVVQWSVDRVGRYWAARWLATDDPAVTAFWQWTDATVLRRARQVFAARELPA